MLSSKCVVELIVEVGVWRNVEVVEVEDDVSGLLAFWHGRLCGAISILMAVAWAHARRNRSRSHGVA